MLRRTIAVAFLIAPLGFAPAPVFRERPNPRAVLQRLQGTWELRSVDGPGGRRSTRARIKGDTWTYVFVTNGGESEGSPSKIILGTDRDLVTLDLELRHPGLGTNPIVLRGIVKVEGKTLSVCYSLGTNAARPRAFAPRAPSFDDPNDKDVSPFTMLLRKLE